MGVKLTDGDSPFLAFPASKWLASNDSAFVIADRFPVSPGHALVVPRRVIATWWEATDGERADILALVDELKRRLDTELQPDGYNVGFNAGTAAGQTVDTASRLATLGWTVCEIDTTAHTAVEVAAIVTDRVLSIGADRSPHGS
jgi:hypothetical protein